MLLAETRIGPASVALERIRRQIANMTFKFEGKHIPLTMSGGIASLVKPTDTLGEILIKADQALYQARAAGRNRVVADASARDRWPPMTNN